MMFDNSRSPHGERGLKYCDRPLTADAGESLSSWRAWIEIVKNTGACPAIMSLSSWRAWIEIPYTTEGMYAAIESLSSWRAWIEIVVGCIRGLVRSRSPHGERGLKC